MFVILYLTYHDLADAALMMLAVPEALSGGAFFRYFFPKIMPGWDAPPMALPVLGGLLISDEVVDLFLPVRFDWVRRTRWLKLQQAKANSSGSL